MSTEQLIDSLKRVLKSRHVTYAVLAQRIGMSEASVKRLFSQRTFTLNRLEQVLTALEFDSREAWPTNDGRFSRGRVRSLRR